MPASNFDSILNPHPQPLVPMSMYSIPDHGMEEEDTSVPFETALQRLHATLNEAVAFFNQLDRSFKEDTMSISVYAKGPVLDKIWRSKVAAAKDGFPVQDKQQQQWQQQRKENSRFQRHKTRFVTLLGKKRSTGTGTGTSSQAQAIQVQTGFHDYVKRVEKDLVEAICARWPPGVKRGFDPEMMSDMALIGLSFMYDRMTDLANRLHAINSEIHRKHSKFRGFIWEVELLQISMESNGEFWQ